jgi:CubicO group peptidase (beta-lactamase class C family)
MPAIRSAARFAVLSLLAALVCVAAPAPRMSDEQIVADLGSSLQQLAKEDKFSGAVLLAKGDKILFAHAYGYADHAFDVLNKVDTKFNLGSMGKMFTGVAVLQLAQQGKLSLDDKLIKDLPDYPNKAVAEKVTIRQLLTHTAGLGDFFGKEFMDSNMARFDTLESLLPLFTDKPLLFEPGSKWDYSNAGFIVLGLVVQHVSGESYYDYVRRHIFQPAGMLNTDNWPADADVSNRALGYTSAGEAPGAPRKSNIFVLQRGGSAGGGYSTVEDLLRFTQALTGGKLLNKEYTAMDMTGQVDTPRPGVKYGFGMEERRVNGVRVVGHGGGGPGINSNLAIYPDLGYTVAIMTNFDNAMPLANQRLELELTGQPLPYAVTLTAAELAGCTGRFNPTPPPGAQMTLPPITITAAPDALLVDVGRGPPHRFLPLDAHEFFGEDSLNARLTCVMGGDGRATGLSLAGIGPMPIKAVRAP